MITREELYELGECLIALSNGKIIQERIGGKWIDQSFEDVLKQFVSYEGIRIKPKPKYIQFTRKDFVNFIFEKVRRKVEKFKDEIWEVVGLDDKTVQLEIAIDETEFDRIWKRLDIMFEEWEFSDGRVFGKEVEDAE